MTPLVARVLHIEAVTWGGNNPRTKQTQNYIARFQGRLISEDTSALYDQLAEVLRPRDITPLFRNEAGAQVVYLVQGVIRPRPSNPWINVIFFVATVFTVLLAGTIYSYNGPQPGTLTGLIGTLLLHLGDGLPFAVALLSILLAHEFGHYFMSRYHKTAASLPYFIPLPPPFPLGTMGAVIIQKESHKNKRILLDIGMAGPLAGFIVAIPVLLLGLALSKVEQLPTVVPAGTYFQMEGNSLLYLFMKFIVFHQLLPAPASYQGLSPVLYWLRYFFTSQPVPLGGFDVMIHPIAFAGWAGLLVTAVNLIPAGQLDGGHIIHSLFGKRAPALLPFILIALVLLGLVWSGWWLWALLIFFLGRTYAEPLDQITPLDTRRKILAVICLIIFILVFSPVPLSIIM